MTQPADCKSLALISDLSLGLFLSMSLMSMRLWELIDLALPMLMILTCRWWYWWRSVTRCCSGLLGRLRFGGDVRRLHGYGTGGDAKRHRQHERSDQDLRPITQGVSGGAAGRRVLYRYHQLGGHPGFPEPGLADLGTTERPGVSYARQLLFGCPCNCYFKTIRFSDYNSVFHC